MNIKNHLSLLVSLAVLVSVFASCQEVPEPEILVPMPEMVDLGLSVKWRSWNLGATRPEEYGLYYQWGDTVGYGPSTPDGESLFWYSYKWCNGSTISLTKYNTKSNYGTVDNKTVLEMEDDAARANLGGMWRTPTIAEWREIFNSGRCSWKWYTMNGVNGYLVRSLLYTNRWIFLPAGGGGRSHDFQEKAGILGVYWSSSLNTDVPYGARAVGFNMYQFGTGDETVDFRYSASMVRPVCE